MKRSLLASSCVLVGLWSGFGFAAPAKECAHPYEKILPYSLPIGGDKAYVTLTSQLSLNYDCQSFIAQGDTSIFASFLNLDLDILNAQATAYAGVGSTPEAYEAANAYAKVTIMGYEVAREDLDLGTLVDINPSQDIDYSGTIYFNVGPVPVPLKYGVEGVAGLGVKGGVQGFGLGLDVVPNVDTKAYVQAGIDAGFAKAVARGEMVVIYDKLKNRLQLGIEDSEQLSLRINAHSSNELKALEGSVNVSASAMSKDYERVLFDWPGYAREDILFEFSDRLAVMQ